MRQPRHPVRTGVIGLVVLAGLMLAAFHIEDLPLIGGGTGYAAAFRDASGLAPGNEVRVAGVKVGKVTGVSLDRDGQQPFVRVDFRVNGVQFGSETVATIRIKTVLGQKYLALAPSGTTPLRAGARIALDHTASPLDVVDAVNGLADTLTHIDADQLSQAFTVLSQTFADTPESVRSSLAGLSRLTQSVADRDDELRTLLAHARAVTGVLADNDQALQNLVVNGNRLLDEVIKRRDAIHDLLVTSTQLATEISGLVADNRSRLGPALSHLNDVLAILQRDRNNLDQTVARMAPFIDAFTNVLGNGRWFDSYLAGLLQPYQPSVGGP
jgi:phospholipid/cholesterol/gamma-HCH transport system substrate-binding protein